MPRPAPPHRRAPRPAAHARRAARRRRRPRPPAGRWSGCRCSGRGRWAPRVPPVDTTTCSPARSPAGRGDGERRRGDDVGLRHPSRSAVPAGERRRPRDRRCGRRAARSVSTFATVAGCRHISVCIAGATTTGADVASSVVPSRSSARPAAIEASVLAVAGATITRSALRPRATWRTSATSSCTEVVTGLRLIASHVVSPTKRSASAVGTTCTSWPVEHEQPHEGDCLVGRDSACHADYDEHSPILPRARSRPPRKPLPRCAPSSSTFPRPPMSPRASSRCATRIRPRVGSARDVVAGCLPRCRRRPRRARGRCVARGRPRHAAPRRPPQPRRRRDARRGRRCARAGESCSRPSPVASLARIRRRTASTSSRWTGPRVTRDDVGRGAGPDDPARAGHAHDRARRRRRPRHSAHRPVARAALRMRPARRRPPRMPRHPWRGSPRG